MIYKFGRESGSRQCIVRNTTESHVSVKFARERTSSHKHNARRMSAYFFSDGYRKFEIDNWSRIQTQKSPPESDGITIGLRGAFLFNDTMAMLDMQNILTQKSPPDSHR